MRRTGERSHRSRVLALSGGVGGAKLCTGLAAVLPPEELTIVANTADDFTHWGLHISPDLDSVMYALAGRNDRERGWGLAGESWRVLEAMKELGADDWFQLGDTDLATHLRRTEMLRHGSTLGEATEHLARSLGVACQLVPMSDNPIRTRIHTNDGRRLDFQHWFVREACEPIVEAVSFDGAPEALPNPVFAEALAAPDLRGVIICPSNPLVSIDPILAIPGVLDALRESRVPVVAVSPIIGGEAVKGPAARMLEQLGQQVSALGIARHYRRRQLLDVLLIDEVDRDLAAAIEAAGARPVVCNTLMRSEADRRELARRVLAALETG